MKLLHAVALGAGAGAVLGVVARRLGRPSRPPGQPSILLIGDSHAQGLDGAGAIRQAALASGARYMADPHVGTTVGFWAPSLAAADIAAASPTIVLVSLGGNDTAGGLATQQYRDQVAAGIQKIADDTRAAGAVLVWLESPVLPWPDLLGLPAMWRAAGALILPGQDFDQEPRDSMNVHLLPDGYGRWGAWIWSKLKAYGLVD